jgi:hypothetical protein
MLVILVIRQRAQARWHRQEVVMRVKVGQRIVFRARPDHGRDRDAEVLEVLGADGAPPYVVRWSDDGHEALVYPGLGAFVSHPDGSRDAS